MRRDLDIDYDPAEVVLAPPDRSELKEIFRRFEFRGLLSRVDTLDDALPAAPMAVTGVEVTWREGALAFDGRIGYAAESDRAAVADETGVILGPRPARVEGELVVHDAKALRVEAADDTLLAAYLIEPGRSTYELDDLGAEYGIELLPTPATDEETAALVRSAELPRRIAPILLERLEERGATALYRDVEMPLTQVLAEMESTGVKIDTYRMGEITARLSERVAELEARAHELAGEEFMLGSTQQVRGSCSRSWA